MTDEEMAEEYENVQDYCGLLDVLFVEQYNQDYGGLSCYISPYIEQAFLAGIEAGRPKWHKISDGDLPEEEGEYLVCYETDDGNYRNTFILNYTEYDESLHWCDEAFETYDEGVIAWCEIPKYTEE